MLSYGLFDITNKKEMVKERTWVCVLRKILHTKRVTLFFVTILP